MADFWIQIRDRKQPYDDIILYQVVRVYDDHEVVEPPSPNSNLGFLHATGCPDHVTKRRLERLLTTYYRKIAETPAPPTDARLTDPQFAINAVPEFRPPDEPDWGVDVDPASGLPVPASQRMNLRNGQVDIENLPNPYRTQFYANKTVDIPFGILVSKIFHRGHGRNLTQDDV